ncbi:MAG: lipopolysaccharide heptosyltransferase II [Deltaproteobacteria bacterium]|nr:lipopolysaccharide heptosyltransferase II [Deltaproteobacteria bacterium]
MNPGPLPLRKILIRSTNWLGDALLTTPAIHSISINYPAAELTMLARPGVAPVFEANPDIRRVIRYEQEGRHGGWGGRFRLARSLKQEGFDGVVHFPHSFESAWISFLAGIPLRVGYTTEGRGWLLTHRRPLPRDFTGRHQVRTFAGLLTLLGIASDPDPQRDPLRLTIPDPWERQAEARLVSLGIGAGERLVGLAPGAMYGTAKCWPLASYLELAARLQREWQARVLFLGTAGDALALGRTADLTPGTGIDLMGQTSLGEVLALIRRCHLLVVNDSGLMHAGAALNTPLVALFGSTSPERTGPWGGTSRVIRKQFSCGPCFKKVCPEPRL